MPTIDFQPLLSVLGDFWKEHDDLPKIKAYWEALIRAADNEWLQLRQFGDSRVLGTLPTFIYHDYLYRHLEGWKDTGVFHQHYKKSFRATAGQAIFYPGVFVEPVSTRVYIEGKELDATAGDFQVVYEQDSTQPGVNPRGSRIILPAGIPASSSVQMVADRETFWIDHTFTAPALDFAFAHDANLLSVKVVVESFDITSLVQIDVLGTTISYRTSGATNPNTQDTRKFLRGETIRVVDGLTTIVIQVTADSPTLTVPAPVNPASLVYRVLNLDVSEGMVVLEAKRIRLMGQAFPPNTRVRVIDLTGAQTFDVTTPTDTIELDREVNPETAEVTFLSGSIYGLGVSDKGVSFRRSFQAGVRLFVRGDYHLLHDHASYHVELAQSSDRASVPNTRPWVLTPAIVEIPELPIEVYVDGMLQHPSAYIFLPLQETFTVRFVNGLLPNFLPAGTVVDFFYADHEDDRLHRHVHDRFVAADNQFSIQLSAAHSERFGPHITLDGVLQNNPANYGYTRGRDFIHFDPPLADGTIVKVDGERLELPYTIDVDTDIVSADFIREDLPESRVVASEFFQNGLDRNVTVLSRQTTEDAPEAGFSIEQTPSTVSGFTLRSSGPFEEGWFRGALVDEKTAWRNFGSVVSLKRDSSDQYVRTVQAMFNAYFRGSQRYTLENFVDVIMGSAFLDEEGTLVRVDVSNDDRKAVVSGGSGEKTYTLSQLVPDRTWSGREMPRFHALTEYCRFLDLTETNCPWLPVAAEALSVDFAAARRFDVKSDASISGVDPVYDANESTLRDPLKDFVAGDDGEVWVGDLISVVWSGGSSDYGRVTEIIDRDTLRVRLSVPSVSVGYGDEAFAGSAPGIINGWGGLRANETVASYVIAARKTRRIDTHRFLDAMDPEDFPYATQVLVPLFRQFVSLIRFNWEGLREGLLDDVKLFLDTAKPAGSGYIAFASVNEDEGLEDPMAVVFDEDDPEIDLIPNLFAVGVGAIDGGNPVGSSVGVA